MKVGEQFLVRCSRELLEWGGGVGALITWLRNIEMFEEWIGKATSYGCHLQVFSNHEYIETGVFEITITPRGGLGTW